jgi:hypothetical protein
LSQREWQRIKVIENAIEGRLTVQEAAELLPLSPTFAIGGYENVKLLYFQWSALKGLHCLFSGGRGSSERAARRGGGWLGNVSLR